MPRIHAPWSRTSARRCTSEPPSCWSASRAWARPACCVLCAPSSRRRASASPIAIMLRSATAAGVFYAVSRHIEDLGKERAHPVFLLDEAHLLVGELDRPPKDGEVVHHQ